jgi:hypothetical protein
MQKHILILIVIFSFVISVKADIVIFDRIVTTSPVNNYNETFGESGGTVELQPTDPDVKTWGICWNTSGMPSTADDKTEHTGTERSFTYTDDMTGLQKHTDYYVRAYIINDDSQTIYGQEVQFKTVPTLSEWALIIFGSLTVLIGGWKIYRRLV